MGLCYFDYWSKFISDNPKNIDQEVHMLALNDWISWLALNHPWTYSLILSIFQK